MIIISLLVFGNLFFDQPELFIKNADTISNYYAKIFNFIPVIFYELSRLADSSTF